MRRTIRLLLMVMVWLLAPGGVLSEGGTFYVSPSGLDTNPGTISQPWHSPAYGTQSMGAGDELILLPGTYILSDFGEDILRPPSGTPSHWTIIRGLPDLPRPVLAGRDNLYAAVSLDGINYLHMEHIEITHDASASGSDVYFRDGIAGTGGSLNHIVLRDLHIHHLDQFGLDLADVNNLLVESCTFTHCGFGAIGGPVGNASGWTHAVISDCLLSYGGHYYQGSDDARHIYSRPDGLGLEPGPGPITICHTTSEHNYGDGLDSKIANTTIDSCVIANNTCDGVKLWGGGSRIENSLIYGRGDGDDTATPWAAIVIDSDQSGGAFEITNCTIDDALGKNYVMYVQYDSPQVPLDLTLRNNIFSARGPSSSIWVAAATVLTARHNLFYAPQLTTVVNHGATYNASELDQLGTGNLYGDPMFVAPAWGANGNYDLLATSPAIDRADPPVAPLLDLAGKSRDASPDMGALEYIRLEMVRPLSRGWNLVSLSVVPEDKSPAHVLASLSGEYTVLAPNPVDLDDWLVYSPTLLDNQNSLRELDELTPFWIHTPNAQTLIVEGNVTGPTQQTLAAGWNLVAYPCTSPKSVHEALTALSYDQIVGYDPQNALGPWLISSPTLPAWTQTLAQLEPGYAYYVYTKAPYTLSLDGS